MVHQGILILEFANKRNLKAILRYALKKQTWNPFALEPVEFAELNFDFHPKAVRRYLAENHFEIERQLTVSHFRVEFLKRHLPTRILVTADGLLQWTGSFAQYSPSVFTRARVVGNSKAVAGEHLFKCVSCGAPLAGEKKTLHCDGCGREWEYRDGIYDFRQKDA
jgi:hypothetical protein